MNLLVQKHGFHLYANKLQSDKDSYRKRKQSYLHRNQENKYMLRIKLAKWERNRTAEQRTIAPHKHILPALRRIAKNDPKVLLYVKGMSDDIFLIIPTTFRIQVSSNYENHSRFLTQGTCYLVRLKTIHNGNTPEGCAPHRRSFNPSKLATLSIHI
jgi:hypothetical protein